MSDAPGADQDAGRDDASGGDPQPPPDLSEALRQIGAAARASLDAAGDTGKALRSLVAADFSLARSAFGRTLAFTGVAIVFGASAWLLLMTALIVFLGRQLGWPWWAALLGCAALSLIAAALAVRRGMFYFEHTRMQATRRQLARLGIGELAGSAQDDSAPDDSASDGPAPDGSTPQPDSAEPTRTADGGPRKDARGVDITPP